MDKISADQETKIAAAAATGMTFRWYENFRFPEFVSKPKYTESGTAYLTSPGVVLLSKPVINTRGMHAFLQGFPDELGFESFMSDPQSMDEQAGARLCQTAGQLCYMSFGPNRTKNADAAKYFENILSSGHGCYDIETDVLTADGWKAWPDVTVEDQLATRTSSGAIEYHRPSRLVGYRHKGRMYRVDGRGVDLLVTPDHKMLVCPTTTLAGRKRQSFELVTAQDLGSRSHAYVKSGRWDGPTVVSPAFPTAVAALLGFTIGDGNLEPHTRNIRFHLRRERKIAWLRATVARLGWAFSEHDDRYSVSLPEDVAPLFHETYNDEREKVIPQRLLTLWGREMLEALFEGLMQSDGHEGRTGDSFDTTSMMLADQVQQLCLHIGLAANVCYTYGPERRTTSFGSKPMRRLSIIRRELKPEVNKFVDGVGKTSWVDDWEGDVYCAEVPNNTLYVRRNGVPVWSGNSVIEHVQFSFLLHGISRSQTHELVRHRAGAAYSQVSQRYVNGKVLRFVERPEYQANEYLHKKFLLRIDEAARDYDAVAKELVKAQGEGSEVLSGEKKTDLRKKVNQCARSLLPNETEAPMVFSANVRALRHIIEMRANPAAEVEIRALAFRLFLIMQEVEPVLFQDFTAKKLDDGTYGVEAKYRKV